MAGQLDHLMKCATMPTVDIRVLPFRAGTLTSAYGTFSVFELPTPFPEVAYTETMAGALYIEPPQSERFTQAYARHISLALGPTESVNMISAMAKEWR